MAKKKDILQRIEFHTGFGMDTKMFMESRDGISVQMIWNNITGKNFKGDKKGHAQYLLMMKHESGLPSGYIQFYPDYSNKDKYEEYCVPASSDIDIHKLEIVNRGGRIINAVATEFKDLFVSTTDKNETKYIHGLNTDVMFKMTEMCETSAKSWHCTQWGHKFYFEAYKRDNGITDIYIKADQIIASSLFACVYTNTLPAPKQEEVEQEEESILAISTQKDIVMAKMTAMDVLKQCTIDGRVIRLPKIKLEKELYDEVKSILNSNGGEWKGFRIQGFLFPFDPKNIFEQLQSGNKVNNKKTYQFFGTPDKLADTIVEKAEIELFHNVLEPSAGQGAIVRAIHRRWPNFKVECFELMEENREILETLPRVVVTESDFLKIPDYYFGKYDRIVANPPFSNNQDIDHCMKMYECLNKGGRIVTVLGTSWIHGKQKKQEAFRKWLKEVDATIEDVPAGTFSESGTTVKTVLCIINKF